MQRIKYSLRIYERQISSQIPFCRVYDWILESHKLFSIGGEKVYRRDYENFIYGSQEYFIRCTFIYHLRFYYCTFFFYNGVQKVYAVWYEQQLFE